MNCYERLAIYSTTVLDKRATIVKLNDIFRSRTNVHYLVFHLTIADTLVSFITMPLEAAWRFTLQERKVIIGPCEVAVAT